MSWLTSCWLFFHLRDREVQLEVQRWNGRPRCHTSDKQISDWPISRSPADRPVARTRQVGALGDSTAPSYRTASPLPAAALQLIQLDSVTEDVWVAITLVARCQFASVCIKWLGGDRACEKKKGRLTLGIRSHFRFSNVSFTRRVIGKINPDDLSKDCTASNCVFKSQAVIFGLICVGKKL